MSTFAIDLISGKEFLFNGTFVNSGSTTFTGITSGNNGISIGAPHQLKLGGTLTCSTVLLQGVGNTAGVEYGGDYSATYSNRSLVDKGYADTKLKISVFTGYSATTLANINTRLLKSVFTGYTATTGLQQVTTIGATTNHESTFNGGLRVSKIRPTGNTTTAIQIHKADGLTHVINIDTISGFTGFGTTVPNGLVHTFGIDNVDADAGFNTQHNAVITDGAIDVDKDIQWGENGNIRWIAQTYRNENSKYWYLYNVPSQDTPIVISESGRMGINNQTDIIDYHAAMTIGNGLNDIELSGLFTQSYLIVFQIQINDTGNPDTFKWRKSLDYGQTFGAYSSTSGLTTTPVELEFGVNVNWTHLTGHTSGNTWTFGAFPQLPLGTFVVSTTSFNEVQHTNDYTAGTIIYEDITAKANSSSVGGTEIIFNTGTTLNAIYFGTLIKIDAIFVNLKTAGASMVLLTEYWNGSTWVDITTTNNNYVDGTINLTQSGSIGWEVNSMTDWIKTNIPDLTGSTNTQYWLRLRTSTNPTIAPVAISFARGGDKRFAVLTSPTDFIPSFYVDSLGRTSIGGGTITGKNVFQINKHSNLPVLTGGAQSLAEIDSEDSSVVDLKIKLSSDDALSGGLTMVSTRGTIMCPADTQIGDSLGHVDFRGRFGSCGSLLGKIEAIYTGLDGSDHNGDISIKTTDGTLAERVRITSSGTTGFGVSYPVAVAHLCAGTTSIAPLKFTAGPLLTTPQVGAVEFDGHCFKFTVSGSTIRKTFASLESPQFSGNTNLPSTTCLNAQNLCNYILFSGGTNNNSLTPRTVFNALTACTAQVKGVVISGVTNGLTKTDCNNMVWGGILTQDTVITGNTHNITISGKLLNFCGVNGIEIIDTSSQGIDISSNGNSVDIRGGTIGGVEKTKFLVSATQATFTDSRTTPNGIQYAADYSSTYTDRSLVDKAFVVSIATGIIVKAAVVLATTAPIVLSGNQVIDGDTTTTGMRVLVKDQASAIANGIYSANTGSWGRTPDFNGVAPDGTVSNSDYMTVTSGNTNKNTSWILQTANPITVGVTPLTFVLFSTSQGVSAGNSICVTQSGGNNVVAVKLAATLCGLCSDASGLYITPTIGGVGICFDGNTLCFNGSAIAGNSLSWTGTQLVVNTTGGTLSTALNSKLNVNNFNTYTGNTQTTINGLALKTSIATYTGTTAPAQFASKTAINTYTGTTAVNTYVCKTNFNTYTGATHTCMDRHAYLSGATFTGAVRGVTPATNDNTTCFATTAYYIGQAGTANPLMNAGVCVGTSNLFSRQDHVHPKDSTKLSLSGGTMTGALVINSNLTVTGTTIHRGTTCLGSPATANISTDQTLFRNPTTCAITAIKLTGGSDSYFYTDTTTSCTIGAGTTLTTYLSGTPWTFLAGRYQVDFQAMYGNSTGAGQTCAAFDIDGTVIGTCYNAGGEVTNWFNSASMSRDVTFTAGCHCLRIRFARGANTACMTYGMIRAKRIC